LSTHLTLEEEQRYRGNIWSEAGEKKKEKGNTAERSTHRESGTPDQNARKMNVPFKGSPSSFKREMIEEGREKKDEVGGGAVTWK